jgi:site-specific DNA-cytosine methylase
MRILELFSGTGSWGKICTKKDYEVISVDINDYEGKFSPTHKINILEFDYKQYDKDFFDIITGSPPCIYYSALQRAWIGKLKKDGIYTIEKHNKNLENADTFVKKTFEIIDYFNPSLWFVENPQTGTLKNREFMKDKPYYDIDYCRYSNWGYRKRTRIWTNKLNFNAKLCNKKCGNMVKIGKRHLHKKNCGNSEKQKATRNVCKDGGSTTKLERYRIPPKLIEELLNF